MGWIKSFLAVFTRNSCNPPAPQFSMGFQAWPHGTCEDRGWLARERDHEGELKFSFPDSKQSFVLHKGDVFNFPNILHHGECMTDACHFMAVYSPNRADFGPEGTPMTKESNIGLNESAGNK